MVEVCENDDELERVSREVTDQSFKQKADRDILCAAVLEVLRSNMTIRVSFLCFFQRKQRVTVLQQASRKTAKKGKMSQ